MKTKTAKPNDIKWNSKCKLLGVSQLGEITNIANQLPLENMHDQTYNSILDLYSKFKENVPNKRLSIWVSKDTTGKNPLWVLDTKMLGKEKIKQFIKGAS